MKKILYILILSTFISFGACKNNNNDKKESKNKITISDNKDQIINAKSTNISGKMTINPSEIKKMQPIKIKLNLSDLNNKKIEKANIVIDLIMPAMKMPKNEVKLKEIEPGIYIGDAIFTMKGDWRLNTFIETNNKKETLAFDTVVK